MTYPDRIVSLAPSNTEILYEIGAGDRIVATTAVCDHPADATDKPSVGGWTDPDVETVASFDPDLVIASDALQDNAVAACREAGMNVLQVRPTTFSAVFNSIKQIGETVGNTREALKLCRRMNAQVRDVASGADCAGIRVYCEEWHRPPMISGNWVPGIVSLLGAQYPLPEGERSRPIELDELILFDPDHIFLHVCGTGEDSDPAWVTDRDGWDELTAVQHGNVHILDDSLLNRPGPRLVDGMRAIRAGIMDQNSL